MSVAPTKLNIHTFIQCVLISGVEEHTSNLNHSLHTVNVASILIERGCGQEANKARSTAKCLETTSEFNNSECLNWFVARYTRFDLFIDRF